MSHLNGCSEHPADEGEDDAIDRHGDSVDNFVTETVGRPRSVAGNGLHGYEKNMYCYYVGVDTEWFSSDKLLHSSWVTWWFGLVKVFD